MGRAPKYKHSIKRPPRPPRFWFAVLSGAFGIGLVVGSVHVALDADPTSTRLRSVDPVPRPTLVPPLTPSPGSAPPASTSPPTTAASPSPPAATAPPTTATAASPPPAATASTTTTAREPTTRPSTTAVAPPGAAAAPARVRIPAIGASAAVVAVGVDGQGALGVPGDASTVGWWGGGPKPGSVAGTVVIDGRVGSEAQGPGALFHLADLMPGDEVAVTTTGGEVRYRVEAVRPCPSGALPEDVFATDGPPRLALITCGGESDHRVGYDRDGIVTYAVPVSPPSTAATG